MVKEELEAMMLMVVEGESMTDSSIFSAVHDSITHTEKNTKSQLSTAFIVHLTGCTLVKQTTGGIKGYHEVSLQQVHEVHKIALAIIQSSKQFKYRLGVQYTQQTDIVR